MNKFVSRGLWTVLATGGFMALGVGVAHADTGTSGEDGIASGTQGILGIQLPIQLGGNAISILGDADSSGASTSAPAADSSPTDSTSGAGGTASGTQLLPDLGLPITLGGNSISVLGDATSSGAQTAPPATGGDPAASGSTDGAGGTASGTQVLADLGLPITLGGNAISVLGDATTEGSATTPGSADAAGGPEGATDGTGGILGGTQVLADLGLPVTLGGNAISVLGDATTGGTSTGGPGSDPGDDPGSDPGTDPGDDPGTDPGTDPGADPGDDTDSPRYSFADDGVTSLAATGAEGGLTAIALAALALFAGLLMVRRTAVHRR